MPSQDLSGGNLIVASVAGFDNSAGFFTVVGGTGTCAYTGRDIVTNKLTGITGCTGTPADGAVVTSAVTENGSGKGVNHAAVELEYYANVNVYGNSTLTAVGDVTLASNVDVTSTANAVPVKGNWVSGTAYSKGDVVIDTTNNKRYAASKDLAAGVSTTAPSGDSTNWSDASGAGSAIAASTFISHAISHLSDTSTITTSGGNVTISASLKSNITTLGNAIQSGSGAGIAVGVLVTDSEAYVDSTAATPVSAKGLTVSADTDNTAATTGTAAPGGADKGGNGTAANNPTQSTKQKTAAEGKADGKSTTADGNQDVSAALGVTVVIATTQAYISSIRPGGITIDATGGTQKIHAGAKNAASTTADGGNVKFSPDAPTATPLATGGTLADATYYYKIVAIYSTGDSLPSAEANAVVTGGGGSGSVSLSWTAVDNVTGYKIFRGDATGNETLLDTVGVVTTYNDDGSKTPDGSTKPSTSDTNSGIGVGVAVDVAVITTSAFARNANLEATTVTIESTAPSASAFAANAISGAGGSSVGVAGSVAVNVTDSNTTTEIEGTDPVAVNGADLSLGATSNITNAALATAKQSTDGKASGVGISVAINVVNDTTTAGLPVNSVLNGAKNLTITADSTDAMTTTANGGASTGSGTVAFAAQAAISISNITTSATVSTGPDLTLTGGLTAHATQTASVTTKASGDTKGGNAGIGLSLALVVANHAVDSQLERNLNAAGPVSFTADGSSITDTESTASSAGADEKKDGQRGRDRQFGQGRQRQGRQEPRYRLGERLERQDERREDAGGEERRERRDHRHRRRRRCDRRRHRDVPQQDRRRRFARHDRPASLASTENADSKVKTNASATKAKTANIGAAVSINRITVDNEAVVGTNDLIDSQGLSVTAGMRSVGGDQKHSFDTEATSGAGGGKVGIAGALALTIADVKTNAEILSNSGRGPPATFPGIQLNGHDLTLSTTATVESTARAKATDKDSETVGVGAGVAINIVDDTTTTSIDSGARFDDGTATSLSKRVANVSLTATDSDTMTTYAEAGTDGAAGSDAAITPDVAISYPTVTTSAIIDGDVSQSLVTTGAVSVTATQDAKSTTTAKADAGGADVSIGLALALAIVNDNVTATIARNIDAGGAVGLAANGSSDNESEADASAKGAKTKSDDTSGKDVNGKSDDQLSGANSQRNTNISGDYDEVRRLLDAEGRHR